MVRLIAVPALAFLFAAAQAREVAVMVTGEAHGALEPCDCPLDPNGGLARRASLLKSLLGKYENALVVNVGGDAAGGPFDEEFISAGDARLRTAYILRALSAMPLDAFIPGDEELAHGSQTLKAFADALPVVASNLPLDGVRPVLEVRKGPLTFHVSGLTMNSEWPLDGAAKDLAEIPRPDAWPPQFPDGPGVRVLVCHLGEQSTREVVQSLAKQAGRPDIVINAHSRRDPRNVFFVEGIPVVQFPAFGRSVRVALLAVPNTPGSRPVFVRVETHHLGPDVKDDPEVTAIVKECLEKRLKAGRRIRLTLFKMALCPYSPETERRILNLLPELSPLVDFTVRFITSEDQDGRTVCMHGEEEVEESLVQAAIREFYPGLLPAYLRLRLDKPKADWEDLARDAGALPARIRGAIAMGEAGRALQWDRSLCARLGIRSSPTLMVGNRVIDGEPMFSRALSALCRVIPKEKRPSLCSAVPECFSDIDCHQPGMRGECQNAGTPKAVCRRYPAVPVPLSVVRPVEARRDRSRDLVDALQEFFPGLQADFVDWPSPEADRLLEGYGFDVLPAYFASPAIKNAGGFERVKETLVPLETGGFVVDPAATDSAFFFRRGNQAGAVRVFIPAGTETGRQALSCLSEYFANAAAGERPEIRPILAVEGGRLTAPGGTAALEEALRILAVIELRPDHLWPYLEALALSSGSGYWEEPLEKAGLEPALIKRQSRSRQILDAAKVLAADCAVLRLPFRVAVLFQNQEVILPSDRGELLDLMMSTSH